MCVRDNEHEEQKAQKISDVLSHLVLHKLKFFFKKLSLFYFVSFFEKKKKKLPH